MLASYNFVDRIKEDALLIAKFRGALSYEAVLPLLDDLHRIETQHPKGFKRFSDLSELEAILLSTRQIHAIADRRCEEYTGPQVRSAIYTPDPLTYGLMRVYSAVMYPAPIEVAVFYKREEAAAWLEVPAEVLTLSE